jgi:hypothetical protein
MVVDTVEVYILCSYQDWNAIFELFCQDKIVLCNIIMYVNNKNT